MTVVVCLLSSILLLRKRQMQATSWRDSHGQLTVATMQQSKDTLAKAAQKETQLGEGDHDEKLKGRATLSS